MTLSIESIYQTFKDRAIETGKLIEKGFASGLGIFEETLTDSHLLRIYEKHSDYICTYKYTRREEGSTSGADWLWCIGEPGSWISMLVQAKIINPRTKRCQHLNYKGKKTSQRTLLVKFAQNHKLLPLYCIYNHLPPNLNPYAKASSLLSDIETCEWSCFFMSPKHVKKLVGQKKDKQPDLLQYGIPWSFPFLYASLQNNSTLASSVAEALAKLREDFVSFETYSMKKTLSRSQPIHSDDPNPYLLITEDLPKIAVRLLKGSIKPSQSPVSVVSIISPTPINEILHLYQGSSKSRKTKKPRVLPSSHPALSQANDSKIINTMNVMGFDKISYEE